MRPVCAIDLLVALCHRLNALSTLALRATAESGFEVDKALRRWPPAIKRSMGQTGQVAVRAIHVNKMLIAPEAAG
jgi:hypothetical protein